MPTGTYSTLIAAAVEGSRIPEAVIMCDRMAIVLVTVLSVLLVAVAALAAMPPCVDYEAYMHRIGLLNDHTAYERFERFLVAGDNLYFNSPITDAGVVDISDPRAPRLLSTEMLMRVPAADFGYAAGHVFIGDTDGLTVFDVANPQVPRTVAFLPLPSRVTSVCVRGARAYVSRSSADGGSYVLEVVDIGDPASPQVINTLAGLGGRGGCLDGDRLYTLTSTFNILDLSNPDLPAHVGIWDFASSGYAVRDFSVVDGKGYFACSPGDLVIVNLADAAMPSLVGTWASGLTECSAVAVSGSLALVSGYGGRLFAIDVSDSAEPAALGAPLMLDQWDDIAISGGVAYVGGTNSISAVDIGPGDAYDDAAWYASFGRFVCSTDDPDLCLMAGWEGLKVLDHHVPESAIFVATRLLPGSVYGLVRSGSRAFVSCEESGITAFDISDPRSPVDLGVVDGVYSAYDMEASNGYVYAVGGDELYVIDARADGVPQLVSATHTGSLVNAVAVDGTIVYLGGAEAFMSFDVSEPAAPVQRWRQQVGGGVELVAKDGLIYSSGGGIWIGRDTGDGVEFVSQVPCDVRFLCLDGSTAYGVGYFRAEIFDLSVPERPIRVGSIQNPDARYPSWFGSSVTISGDEVIGAGEGYFAIMPRYCGLGVPVEVASFTATRDIDGSIRLRWVVTGADPSTQFRIVVRSTGGERVIPGISLGWGEYEAHDSLAAPSAGREAIAENYVLERREEWGAWLAIATTGCEPPTSSVAAVRLECAPNPFNSGTRVAFTLSDATHVVVTVHDAAGRQVAVLSDALFGAGAHALSWDGRDDRAHAAASGVYLIRMRTGEGVETQKVLYLR